MKTTILLLLLFFCLAFSKGLLAQEYVWVKSKTDNKAVSGVVINKNSEKVYVNTDEKGRADLQELHLQNGDSLVLRHNYFISRKITWSQVVNNAYTIYLQPTTFTLDEFFVTANKWEHQRNEIPLTIEEVSRKEIEFSNPQTAADLLGSTHKVFIQKSQMGGGSPMIRGFAANGVLIVVDGVRMNNAIFRGGNLQNVINIDPNLVGHAEVIFGPGSVTYGSDAMGGVMDFHTIKPEFATDKKINLKLNIMSRYSSANRERTAGFGLNLGFRKFASFTQFSASRFDDLQAGKKHFGDYPDFGKRNYIVGQDSQNRDQMYAFPDYWVMNPSRYDAYFFAQKFAYRTSKKSTLSYQFIYSNTSNIPRYDRLIQWKGDHLKYAQWYYGPQEWMMNALSFHTAHKTAIYDEMKLTAAYQLFVESRHDRRYRKGLLRHRTEKVNALSLNADFEKKLNGKWAMFYGLEVVYNDVNSAANAEDIYTGSWEHISTRYPGVYNHYYSGGIFVNFKYKIKKNLTAMLGARYSRVYSDSKFDTTLNHLPYDQITMNMGAPNGSMGLAWIPKRNWQINFNLSSAFRAPNIDDAAKIFDSEPGNVVVPNENLQPEYAYSAELTIRKDFENLGSMEVGGFYTWVDNVIVRRDYQFNGKDSILYDGTMSKVQAMVNAASGQIYGGSASLRIKLWPFLELESVFTLMKGYDNEGNSLRHVPPSYGSTGLNFKYNWLQLKFFSNYNGGIAFADLAPSEQKKTHMYPPDGAEKWFTLNFKAAARIDLLSVEFGVENILDRFYIPYSSGIPAAGRNIYISMHLHI